MNAADGHNSTHLPAVSTAGAASGAFAAVAVVSAVSPVIGEETRAQFQRIFIKFHGGGRSRCVFGVHGADPVSAAQKRVHRVNAAFVPSMIRGIIHMFMHTMR